MGSGVGEPVAASGFAAGVGVGTAFDEGFVEAVGGLGIAGLQPAAGLGEERGELGGVVGQERGGFPGEVGGELAVVEAEIRPDVGGEGAGNLVVGGRGDAAGADAGGEEGIECVFALPDGEIGGEFGAAQLQSVFAEDAGGAEEGEAAGGRGAGGIAAGGEEVIVVGEGGGFGRGEPGEGVGIAAGADQAAAEEGAEEAGRSGSSSVAGEAGSAAGASADFAGGRVRAKAVSSSRVRTRSAR